MRFDSYLITTKIGKRDRKVIWSADEPLPLDHPMTWILERGIEGLQLKKFGPDVGENTKTIYPIPMNLSEKGGQVKIPYSRSPDKTLVLKIQKVSRLKPAYLAHKMPGAQKTNPAIEKGQMFLFWGTRFYLVGFKAIGSSFDAEVDQAKLFSIKKLPTGYELKTFVSGIKFKYPGKEKKELAPNISVLLKPDVFVVGAIQWEKHWWRMAYVPTPEPLDVDRIEANERDESKIFKYINVAIIGLIALLAGLAMLAPKPANEIKEPLSIKLSAPKMLPPPEPLKPKVEKKVEKKKPEKPKPKPVELKPKKAEVKKVPLANMKPPPPVVAPPQEVAKAPPPPPPPPSGPTPQQIAAQQLAQQKAQVSQSLSFLSTSKSKGAPVVPLEAKTDAYQKSVALNDLKSSTFAVKGDPKAKEVPIETLSSRSVDTKIKGDVRSPDGNKVQGKVARVDLYDPNQKESLGAATQGTGLQMSGAGSLSEAEILKTLKKYLPKFQFCFEKALLADASLGGSVRMEWLIQNDGNVSAVKVLNSQIKNQGFHKCFVGEIEKIAFPAPKGGEVLIRYPFNFTATAL